MTKIHQFLIFFKRDLTQLLVNPRLMILSLVFWGLSLFLFYIAFASEPLFQSNTRSIMLYWIIFLLSTTGVFGQTIARDYHIGFLQCLQADKINLAPYIFSKGLSLIIGWSLIFPPIQFSFQFLQGFMTPWLFVLSFMGFVFISGALSFLYILFDALTLTGQKAPLLSFVLLIPFMLPLFLFTLLSLEQGDMNKLIAAGTYSFFLMISSFVAIQKILKN